MRRPYIRHREHAMDVVRHHDERVDLEIRKVIRERLPTSGRGGGKVIRLHVIPIDLAKQPLAAVRTDRHKVRASPSIVLAGQTNRLAAMSRARRRGGGPESRPYVWRGPDISSYRCV
ncbi:MAG TPA: hypothetical protein VL403_01820 [Candidatus Kryptonia bacterium]|nr:hypothetical protein [Candidatus Kryptonia bacterium]